MEKALNRIPAPLQRMLLAVLLELTVEALSRHSLPEALLFPTRNPWAFLTCVLIVLMTLELSLLFRRRKAALGIVSLAWLVLGVGSFILRCHRLTPLNGQDFLLLPDGLQLATSYLGWFGFIAVILALIGVAVLAVVMIRRCRREPRDLKQVCTGLLFKAMTLALAVWLGLQSGALASYFGNIIRAYEDYGFAYCLSCTLLIRGVDQPPKYSAQRVEDLLSWMKPEDEPDAAVQRPNIIILQLESFMDPLYMEGTTYSSDPVPVFRRLKDSCPSGFFTAPAVGAGTANTEFEVLTGMPLTFFGPGEYPYTTVLRRRTLESMPFVLDRFGYSSHAIHNNTATFYGRNQVYPNLGFDSFTSLEYMKDPQYNPTGWNRDEDLIPQILGAMKSTEEQDFVFAVSVQGHGKYPEILPEGASTDIRVTWAGEDRNEVGYGYYVSQIREQDQFLGDLISALREQEEPVILAAYGDHLPNFPLEPEDVHGHNLYNTEYIIWNNFGLQLEDRDLAAYQLSAALLEDLGIHSGVMFRAHQELQGIPGYLDQIQLLQYDILDGSQVSEEQEPEPSDMTMGFAPPAITGVQQYGDDLYVLGTGFTGFCRVEIDGEKEDSVYISDTVLLVPGAELHSGEEFAVVTDSRKGHPLSRTDIYAEP